MIEFLIVNIFVESGGVIFQQVIGIPIGTNCAPLGVLSLLFGPVKGRGRGQSGAA